MVETVRSCEIGTVSATTMATTNVAIAEVAARSFTNTFGQTVAGLSNANRSHALPETAAARSP